MWKVSTNTLWHTTNAIYWFLLKNWWHWHICLRSKVMSKMSPFANSRRHVAMCIVGTTVKVSVTVKTGHASLQGDAKFTFYRILSINFIFRRNLKLLQWKRQWHVTLQKSSMIYFLLKRFPFSSEKTFPEFHLKKILIEISVTFKCHSFFIWIIDNF